MLSQLLYNQPDLRPPVLRALKVLIDSNTILAAQDKDRIQKYPALSREDAISQDLAKKNVSFLREQAESWLAVLFNVFGSVNRETRGMVGEAISAWASVAEEKVGSPIVLKGLHCAFSLRASFEALTFNIRVGRCPGLRKGAPIVKTESYQTSTCPRRYRGR